MIRAVLTVNTAALEGFSFAELAKIAETRAQQTAAKYTPRLLADLQYEPEAPSYLVGKFEWVSSKQKAKVLALLREQAIERGDFSVGPRGGKIVTDLRYQRTHALSASWKVDPRIVGGRFIVDVSTDVPSARFVGGDLNQRSLAEAAKPQQPFHAGRWPLFAERIRFWFDLMDKDYREAMRSAFGSYVKVIAKRRSFR